MNLIAIETSTEMCAVALSHHGQVTEVKEVAPQKHAELVLVYLQTLLDQQGLRKIDIDGIVFGQGPGAFTGVRIATSIVQGLALALDIPVLPVSTLKNLAHQIWFRDTEQHQRILVANDARMGEVYWAAFETKNEQLIRLSADAICAPEALDTAGFDVCVGSAFKSMVSVSKQVEVCEDMLPDAITLLDIAEVEFSSRAQNIIDIQPSYIREKVVFS